MNIAQAKQIPLRGLVEHLGGRFSHNGRAGETWFYSPFRPDERTASFKVNENTNKWHDFARTEKLDAHGDILDLWTDFHNKPRKDSEAIKGALKVLQTLVPTPITPHPYQPVSKQATPKANASPRYKLLKNPARIYLPILKQELSRRRLSLADVQPLLKQAHILDTKTNKTYYGFAFENDKGGFDISIPNPKRGGSFKTTIGAKWMTAIQGSNQTAQVYEGFWDFYTLVCINKGLVDHTHIILNSASNIRIAADYLIARKHSIHSVFAFLDNDPAGEKATHGLAQLLESTGMIFGTKNHLYEGYKDLNEYWVHKNHPQASKLLNSRPYSPKA